MFTFEGTLKAEYNFEKFDSFETDVWAERLKPSIKQIAEKIFAKIISSCASNSSIDSAYGSDELHFDASHDLLGPANDSRYSSMDDLPSDVKEEVNSLQLIHFW